MLIAAERGSTGIEHVVADGDDVVIAAITVAELLAGVELADAGHRTARLAFIDSLLAAMPIETYGLETARMHAELLAHRRSGRRRGAHDLLIAATARACGRIIVTADASGFADLPGMIVRGLPASPQAGTA
jgi:tRNA(fMet)-specific endonuclease VapC